MDCHKCSINDANKYTRSDQHTCFDGYPNPDLQACANLYQYAGASLDPASDRYPLGHLDAEPNADQHVSPEPHPCTGSFCDIHLSPNLDASSDRYTLAISISHQYQIKNARNHHRSQPCL